MKKVLVTWLKSPRHKYRIPRAKGTGSLIDLDLAKKIRKEAPDFFISPELDALERPIPRKVIANKVQREK